MLTAMHDARQDGSMPVRSRRLRSTDGVDLTVHDFGGDGPTLLLAHATGFHGLVWSPLVAHLGPDTHCVAVDFRGHGDSSAPLDGTYRWAGFADDILTVVGSLTTTDRPRPLFGVGHSKGGAALLLAEQRRPGTFDGLYCFEPVVMPPPVRAHILESDVEPHLATDARRRRRSFRSFDDALDNFSSKPPMNTFDPAALSAYIHHGFATRPDGTVELKCRPEDEATVYLMAHQDDAFELLSSVACPVTVAAGALAESGPAAFAEQIAEALPAGRFEFDPSLGHFGPMEHPALVAEQIRRALLT
jgi:pimeloyl-ACP methyl ester carboxylesterase